MLNLAPCISALTDSPKWVEFPASRTVTTMRATFSGSIQAQGPKAMCKPSRLRPAKRCKSLIRAIASMSDVQVKMGKGCNRPVDGLSPTFRFLYGPLRPQTPSDCKAQPRHVSKFAMARNIRHLAHGTEGGDTAEAPEGVPACGPPPSR